MDVARAMQKLSAFAFGIVNAVDGSLDLVDRVLRKFQRETGAGSRSELGDGVERRIDI